MSYLSGVTIRHSTFLFVALSLIATLPSGAQGGAAPPSDPNANVQLNPNPNAPAPVSQADLQDLKQALEDQRKEFLATTGGADKLAQVVTCNWKRAATSQAGAAAQQDTSRAHLDCNAGLLIGGDYIAAIQIVGLPSPGDTLVQVVAADVMSSFEKSSNIEPCPEWVPNNTGNNLSCDEMGTKNDAIFVAVHKDRLIRPSYGGNFANALRAKAVLRRGGRRQLSLVVSSNVQVILVTVKAGSEIRSAAIPVAYQRWTFESGGFYGFSNLTDEELVTKSGTKGMVLVQSKNRSGRPSQETGVFVNMVPRNYPALGIGFGLTANSDRAQSVYLGPSIRLVTFGEHGLASLCVALADRQVKVFPGVVGQEFAADSANLKGHFVTKLGYAVLINLGFKFGASSTGGGSNPTPAKPVAVQ